MIKQIRWAPDVDAGVSRAEHLASAEMYLSRARQDIAAAEWHIAAGLERSAAQDARQAAQAAEHNRAWAAKVDRARQAQAAEGAGS